MCINNQAMDRTKTQQALRFITMGRRGRLGKKATGKMIYEKLLCVLVSSCPWAALRRPEVPFLSGEKWAFAEGGRLPLPLTQCLSC